MPDNTPRTGTTKSHVNLRKGAGTNFPVMMLLQPKTPVLILGQEGQWFKVNVNSKQGFIRSDFIILPTEEVISGFLIHRPEVADWPLLPAVPLKSPAGGGGDAKMAARIWNKFGGLLEPLAAKMRFDPGVAVAVVAAESGGSGFVGGRMIIRIENHHFWKFWGKQPANRGKFKTFFSFDSAQPWKKHLYRSATNRPWRKVHVDSQDMEWEVFGKALSLNEPAAKLSISMGLPQILGSNHAACGYESAGEMFDSFSKDEKNQLIGFFDFIQGPHSVSDKVAALKNKQFTNFASLYNGPGQASHYGTIIRNYFEAFGTLKP
jgi:hypothetical protein